MLKADIDAFYADLANLDPQKYLVLSYYFESLVDPKRSRRAPMPGNVYRAVESCGCGRRLLPRIRRQSGWPDYLDKPTQPCSPFLASLIGKPYDQSSTRPTPPSATLLAISVPRFPTC